MDYLEAEPAPSISNGTLPSSSSSVASRLYMNGQRESRNSFSSEPELMNFNDDIHAEFSNATNQMSLMAQKLSDLQEEKMAINEEKSRLRTDNAILQERVHLLEEQLQTSEQRWTEKWEDERTKARELAQRVERERHLEAERETLKQQMMTKEVHSLEKDKDRLSEQLSDMKQRVMQMHEQMAQMQQERDRAEVEKQELKNEYDRYKREVANKMENSTEMLEELTRQTDMLRQNGLELPRQGSFTDQIIVLEDEIERLRLENRELREQNDDLQAQLLHDSVECGRNLIANGQTSLAAELGGMDSQGLLNKLKEQEIINQRLRNYVKDVLEKIMKFNPEILEIRDDDEALL